MNNGLLLPLKNTLIYLLIKRKQNHKKTLQIEVNKLMHVFAFSPPTSLSEEEKWPLAAIVFDANNSVSNISVQNNSFSISTPRLWFSRGSAKPIDRLQKILKLRSQNYNNLHVENVEKKGLKLIKIFF